MTPEQRKEFLKGIQTSDTPTLHQRLRAEEEARLEIRRELAGDHIGLKLRGILLAIVLLVLFLIFVGRTVSKSIFK